MSATPPGTTSAPRPPRPAPSLEVGISTPVVLVPAPVLAAPMVPVSAVVAPEVPAPVVPSQAPALPSQAPALPAPVLPAALIPAPARRARPAPPGESVRAAGPSASERAPVGYRPVPAAPPRRELLLPGLVVAGVTHAGAAALTAHLARHPQVCLPAVKRIGHFSPLRYGRAVHEPLDEYDRHFVRWSGQRYRLENGPDYFDGGPPLARQLAAGLPGARVVLVLRDPAERLWSSYTDKLARGRLPRAMTFETYVERCLALRANGADRFEGNRHFRTLSSGFYAEYLPGWVGAFGSRLRVVFTEQFADDAPRHLADLLSWLGLDPDDATPAGADVPAFPVPDQANLPFNRRLWPALRRATAAGTPRLSERTRARVRSLYALACREVAGQLRDLGHVELPDWLTQT